MLTSMARKKYIKKRTTKKKEKHVNLVDSEKEQLQKYENEGKKVMRHNLDDEKGTFKKRGQQKKKRKA